MTDSQPTRPQRLHDTEPEHNDLMEPSDPIEEEEEHGRIGYGRFGERTPYILAIGIVATVLIIAGIDWWQDQDGNGSGPARIGDPAPTFEVPLLDGGTFDLADQRGKVVVLNFWGTWCEPCKEEMPALRDLANANPDDVVVIGVAGATDKQDDVRRFENEFGITYPLAIDTTSSGPVGDIGSTYNASFLPSTVIIDPDGDIFYVKVGVLDLAGFQAIVDDAKTP